MQHKKILLAAGLFSFFTALAQNYPLAEDEAGNVVKVNVLSLPLKNLSVQYEKVLSQKVSVAMGIRYMPKVALPFKSLLIRTYADGDQDTKDIINKSRLGNFAVTPEVRFYLGRGYGQGFYLAPYYRFARFSTNTVTVNYSEPGGVKRSVELSGSLYAHTGGLQAGAQWFLNRSVVLDWWILGFHYGAGTGDFNGMPAKPFTPGEQADIKRAIEEVNLPLVDKTVSVSANKVLVNSNGPFGGLRAGFCVGIRF